MFTTLELKVVGGLLAIAAACGALALYDAHQQALGAADLRAQVAQRDAAAAASALAESQRNAAETQRRLTAQQKAQDAHDKELASAQRDAAAAASAAAGLRRQLATYTAAARRASSHSGAAGDGAPAGDALGVLADLLGRADGTAGELAAALDAAHAAGSQCERSYDALTPQ